MSSNLVTLVNTAVVPAGLTCIMFGMGLSLQARDFREVLRAPALVATGLAGQLILMPALALLVIALFRPPPAMAFGLFALAICPAGTTSNALTFAGNGNVALAVALTALSSLITVFTIPLLLTWALPHFLGGGNAPSVPMGHTMWQLARITLIPVGLGMLIRVVAPETASALGRWLRPASWVVLICVIGISLAISADLVLSNLTRAGPAIWVLNAAGMGAGLVLAKLIGASQRDSMTLAIEIGVHNATMATFLTLSVLKSIELAITPTLYGCVMVLNATLLIRVFANRTPLVAT